MKAKSLTYFHRRNKMSACEKISRNSAQQCGNDTAGVRLKRLSLRTCVYARKRARVKPYTLFSSAKRNKADEEQICLWIWVTTRLTLFSLCVFVSEISVCYRCVWWCEVVVCGGGGGVGGALCGVQNACIIYFDTTSFLITLTRVIPLDCNERNQSFQLKVSGLANSPAWKRNLHWNTSPDTSSSSALRFASIRFGKVEL